MTKEVKQEQNDSVSYIKEVIEALYENGDPVSVEAGELLERIVANQEQHEPVAMRYDFDGYGYKYIDSGSGSDWQTREKGAEPLYTKPQTRKPLTDEQIVAIVREASHGSVIRREGSTSMRIARAIESAHGIKE